MTCRLSRIPVSLATAMLGLVLTFPATAPAIAADAPAESGQLKPADVEFFEKKIRPVLVRECYECHAADSRILQGGLQLDHRMGIRKGGESGPAVVPGKPEDSLLLDALRYDTFEMPPKGKLPEAVIADFEEWIRRGAPDPREGTTLASAGIDLEEGRRFWSFQPLTRPEVPQLQQPDETLSPIDRFIRARLEAEGASPAQPADRRTLIRRLSFDLIGLPPSPAEVEEFLADNSPDATARLVDRLLTSPQFGVRWGRHWLDVVRFAESVGGGRTRILNDAWRYRDYVIDAYNSDKPFNEFVAEQIAGDLLPADSLADRNENLTATGFLVLGPTNYELQDKELLRMEVVDEQMDTLGRAFLGMTIGCARCHDHKFDPIPQADYYALAGIFRSTKTLTPGNVSGFVQQELFDSEQHRLAWIDHQKAMTELQNEISGLQKSLKDAGNTAVAAGDKSVPLARLAGIARDDTQAKLTGNWSAGSSVARFVGDVYRYGNGNNSTARFELPVEQAGRYEVLIAYNAHSNRASNTPVTIIHAEGETTRKVNQRQKPALEGLMHSLGTFAFEGGQPAVVEVGCRDTNGYSIADAVQLLPVNDQGERISGIFRSEKKPTDASPEELAAEKKRRAAEQARRKAMQQKLKSLETELASLKKEAPSAPARVMCVHDEADNEVGDYFLCIRGNVHKLGSQVPRGFLSVITPSDELDLPDDQSGRLHLARWIGSPDNPLTARVYVNRIWSHLFGVGLVRTPDNFGAMGEKPSHPELLDSLATEFIAQGWSTRRLIREIVLTRTYQQSSHAAAVPADPENRWLSRQNRRRLEAEAIRDAILTVSGQLDLSLGGSTIRPGTRSEFGYRFEGLRRSTYVPVFRNQLHGLFEVFDFPDPNLVNGRRAVSTLPTQALYLFNSPFVMTAAEHAAQRWLESPDLDDRDRIRHAWQIALGREPTAGELALSLKFVSPPDQVNTNETTTASAENAELQRWTAFTQMLFACLDFRYID